MNLIRFFVCLVWLLLTFSSYVVGQESIDLITLSGRYGLPSAYDNPALNRSAEFVGLVNVKVPIVFSEKSIWYTNITYTASSIANNNVLPDSMLSPIRLHGIIMQTGLVQRFNDETAIQLLFVPRYMTDGNNVSKNAWQFGGIALFEKKHSERLTMRYGAMYNQEKSGPLLVPLVDVNWKINSKWSIVGLLPIYGKVNYHVNEDLTTGLSFFGLITSYDLNQERYGSDYMERSSIDVTLFARKRLYKNLFGEVRAGYALSRSYAQYRDDENIDLRISLIKIGDNQGPPVNYQIEDGVIFKFRLVYNLKI
jgi:hypothetical protein